MEGASSCGKWAQFPTSPPQKPQILLTGDGGDLQSPHPALSVLLPLVDVLQNTDGKPVLIILDTTSCRAQPRAASQEQKQHPKSRRFGFWSYLWGGEPLGEPGFIYFWALSCLVIRLDSAAGGEESACWPGRKPAPPNSRHHPKVLPKTPKL